MVDWPTWTAATSWATLSGWSALASSDTIRTRTGSASSRNQPA